MIHFQICTFFYYINDLIPEEIEITGSEQKTRVKLLQKYTGSQYSFVINCTALNAGEDTLELPERWCEGGD